MNENPGKLLARGALILMVDDEEAIIKTTSMILEKLGYRVVSSLTGPGALEIFRARHGEISLVMLDLIMPGMTGMEIFSELKKISPDVSVLLTSGMAREDLAGEMLREGAAGILMKPFTINTLIGTLDSLKKK
jgi:two-component system, cell cycle sensor histidine kinase and response regulator CckA